MQLDYLGFLRLMQLADSAVPIGAAAHSFGLESLVAEGYLHVEQLEPFLRDYLEETGALESAFCRLAYRLISDTSNFETRWLALRSAPSKTGMRSLALCTTTTLNSKPSVSTRRCRLRPESFLLLS
jgi:urease accessory protein